MISEARRLLIVSCSRRKIEDTLVRTALERYDGPVFRLLRRFLQNQLTSQLTIHIVSAEFGLIPSEHPIPSYDRQLTLQRAQELNSDCLTKLNQLLKTDFYQEVCICAGEMYLQAFAGLDRVVLSNIDIRIIKGGLGKQLAELHDWLYGEPPSPPSMRPANCQQHPRLRGIEVFLTAEQVLDLGQSRLAESTKGATRYHSWHVLIGDEPVAAKWLASQVTGLPVSAFSAGEARRLLTQLGIEVRRASKLSEVKLSNVEQTDKR